jgi:preprotein translocase subunit SecD
VVCGEKKMKKLSFRIWLALIILIASLFSIFLSSNGFTFFQKGVLITSVEQNSTAYEQGFRQGEIIISIDGNLITDVSDFANYMQEKFPSEEDIKMTFTTKNSEIILFSNQAPNITISSIPKTSLKTGLDLAGGARALIQAEDKELSAEEINDLVAITTNRLNVYGLSDIKVSPITDLSGHRFMLIEIAGATPKDLRNMIENQGKFEAKIANETVFIGGDKDIASVCRNDATCARIESCQQSSSGGYYCNFIFSIYLSEEAARRHADITGKIEINSSNPEYLSEPLDLYLDDILVDSLLISKDLKGEVTTQIAVSGSGAGETQDDAIKAAQEQMHKLQTILITGSLPYKLEIVKLDTISPLLGKNFTKYILFAGIAALISASLVIFIRYRRIKQSLAVILTSLSEMIIILGIAALIKWNLDLASIAGILATIGTGFDDQVVILDESINRKTSSSLKERIKKAFAIIMGAYFTVAVSLLPLMWAGAGLLKGFAITTIIGISVGVFITRPAFSDIVRRIEE